MNGLERWVAKLDWLTWELRRWFSHAEHEIQLVWALGAPGRVLFAALLLSLAGWLFVIFERIWAPQRRTWIVWLVAMISSTAGGAWIWSLARARSYVFASAGPQIFSRAEPIDVSQAATRLTATFVLAGAALLLVAAFRLSRPPTTRALLVAAASIVAVTALGARALADTYLSSSGCWISKEAERLGSRSGVSDAQLTLVLWVRVVEAIAFLSIICCSAFGVSEARCGRVVSRRVLLTSTIILVLGLGAFLATRTAAADTVLWVPDRPKPQRCPALLKDVPLEAPEICRPLDDNPIVLFRDGGWFMPQTVELSESEVFDNLAAQRESFRQTMGVKQFPGVAIAVSPQRSPLSALPLAEFHRRGFSRIFLTTRSESSLQTATLGSFELEPVCCGLEIELDAAAPRLSRAATYEDLVRAARDSEAQSRVLRIAP